MSLNEIELTGTLLSGMYEKVLVAEPGANSRAKGEEASAGAANAAGGLRFLGRNLKNYCFLVEYKDEPFMPDEVMDFLTKILQACRLSMEDIAVVNVASAPVNIELLRQQLGPEKLILLGVSPTSIQLPIQFPHYHPQAYAGCVFLLSDPLHLMDNTPSGKALKTNFWTCLKEMFGV